MEPWLVVIDMQHAFGDPTSGWYAEGYDAITPVIERLAGRFTGRTVYTRFVRDPAETGGWAAYYDQWSDFRLAPDDARWDLTLTVPQEAPVVDEPTFSKWAPALQAVVGSAPLVVCGVATECCVLSTALGAADAGSPVTVVRDACAGATAELHEKALDIMDSLGPLSCVRDSADLLAD